jgi:uncharacterized heparinase superfamily protein
MRRSDRAGLLVESARIMLRNSRVVWGNALLKLPLSDRRSGTANHDVLFAYPGHLRPGTPEIGRRLLAGNFSFATARVPLTNGSPFLLTPPSTRWAQELYGFHFLTHLVAEGSPAAYQLGIKLISEFGTMQLDRKPAARAPQIIARRLMRWCQFLGQSRDRITIVERSALLHQAGRDARLLSAKIELCEEGPAALEAAIGLAISALWLSGCIDYLRPAIDKVGRELKRHILLDGGPANRSPETLSHILADFSALYQGLLDRDIQPPSIFSDYLPRMQAMLAFLCHSDGALSQFHGGGARNGTEIIPLLGRHKKRDALFTFARRTGYQRMAIGKTIILVDTLAPPKGLPSQEAHLSPLAFEFTHGDDRLIINCGANRMSGDDWHLATRGMAAHSCPTMERNMANPFYAGGVIGRFIGPRLNVPSLDVTARRTDDESNIWLEAGHNYFVETHGVNVLRRLYLGDTGQDFRGEDSFVPDRIKPFIGGSYAIRFHLHPDVTPTLQAGGQSCLLITRSGRGWQFRTRFAQNGRLFLEPSVYMNEFGEPQRTNQIVLQGDLTPHDCRVQWAFKFSGQLNRRKR